MNLARKFFQIELSVRNILFLEILLIVGIAIVPLFSSFPYRVNIFLSWEGAYRLYLGQVPFKDFGLPMGFGYWLIPAMFFKIFGPYLITLVKAQVFINILSGLAFRSILKSFRLNEGLRITCVLLFVISYSFFNFWPWYNHSVIVFELIGLSFILKFILRDHEGKVKWFYLAFGTFFIFLSFFTKQDGGGLAFLIAFFLLIYHAIIERKYYDLGFFLLFYGAWAAIFILPLINHEFGYWFNLGQEPHNSRMSLWEIINVTFGQSKWEKFYLAGMILILFNKRKNFFEFLSNKREFMFFLFTLGILVQALIFQVTSYTPPDNNIFFHAFAFAYFFSLLNFSSHLRKIPNLLVVGTLIMLWWSGAYWKYIERKLERAFPSMAQVDEDKISRSTYMVSKSDVENIGMAEWKFSDLKTFKKIYMPESTVEGMDRLIKMDEINYPEARILNMTELTPLAYEIGFDLEVNRPLWYHKGVGMFQREVDQYVKEVKAGYYDVVLFEYIPYLNNFFPEEVRESLREYYQLKDEFLAPRRPTDSYIEVYVKK